MKTQGTPRVIAMVSMPTTTFEYVQREIEESHTALDRLGVVRFADGEKLSLAQRMSIVSADVAKLALLLAQLREAKGVAAQ